MFALEQMFRSRTLGLIFLAGVAFFFLVGWVCLANYDSLFNDDRHVMQGVGIFVIALTGLSFAVWAALMWFIMYPRRWLWLIYKNGWKVGSLIYKREHCEHAWARDPDRPHNSAKRYCPKCGSHESLFQKLYPSSDEPSLNWRPQNFDELRFL